MTEEALLEGILEKVTQLVSLQGPHLMAGAIGVPTPVLGINTDDSQHLNVNIACDANGNVKLASGTLPPLTANANTVFAGPTSGAAAAPAFRALVANDIPNQLNATAFGGVLPTGPKLAVPVAATATASYGLVSIGAGPFDGTTSGFFAGNSNGTHIAVNAASGYLGRMLDLQVAGVRIFGVGKGTVASATSATLNAIEAPGNTIVVTGATHITTATGFNYVTIGAPIYSAASALTIDIAATLAIVGTPLGQGAGPATVTQGYSVWVQGGPSRFDGQVRVVAGQGVSAPNYVPSVTLATDGTTGLWLTSGGVANIIAGTAYESFGADGFQLNSTTFLAWGTDIVNAAGDTQIRRSVAASLVLGAANSASPVAYTLTVGESSRGGTDNNIAGANGTIRSGLGTGASVASLLIFQTPLATGSGTGAQSYVTKAFFNASGMCVSNQANIAVGPDFGGIGSAVTCLGIYGNAAIPVLTMKNTNGSGLVTAGAIAVYDANNIQAAAINFTANSATVVGNILFATATGAGATTKWQMVSAGHFLTGSDNIYDIGASGATRPRTGYFGTSVVAPLLTAGTAALTVGASGDSLGFYGVSPITRAVLATGSTTDQVITALQNLGLVKQS